MIKSRIFKEGYAAISALSKSKSKALGNSKLSNQSSVKCIRYETEDSDRESTYTSVNFEHKEKLDIAKMLDEKPSFTSYMPQSIVKPTNTLIKS